MRVARVHKVLEQVDGFRFGGIKLQELFENFSSLGEFILGDQAACESATGAIEV